MCTEGLSPHPSPRAAASSPAGHCLVAQCCGSERPFISPGHAGWGGKGFQSELSDVSASRRSPERGQIPPGCVCVRVCAPSCIPAGVPCSSEVPAALPTPPLIKHRTKLAVKAAPPGSSTEICLWDAAASAPQLGARGAGGSPSSAAPRGWFPAGSIAPWSTAQTRTSHPNAALRGLPGGSATSEAPRRLSPLLPHFFHPAWLRSGRSSWRGTRLLLGSQERASRRVPPRALGELLFLAALPISRH